MILYILSWIITLGIAGWLIIFVFKTVLKNSRAKKDIKLYKNILKIEKKFKQGFDIFFADAKQTWERIICIFSAVFWTWLEVMFLKFFFIFAFGLTGYILGDGGTTLGSGSFEYSYQTILDNKNLMDAVITALVLIIFILRVPLHYKKEVNKQKEVIKDGKI